MQYPCLSACECVSREALAVVSIDSRSKLLAGPGRGSTGRVLSPTTYNAYTKAETCNAPLALFIPAYEKHLYTKRKDFMAKEGASVSPPALPRRLPISLPPLSPNIPIHTHPIITYHYTVAERFSNVPLVWNISSGMSTAKLRSPDSSQYSHYNWLDDPALKPKTIDSMAIRIPSIEQPVVVFPVHVGLPIRIKDVFRAITRLINHAVVASEGRSDFLREAYWGGLYECPEEQDVWILQLHRPN